MVTIKPSAIDIAEAAWDKAQDDIDKNVDLRKAKVAWVKAMKERNADVDNQTK